jgi:fucose permease
MGIAGGALIPSAYAHLSEVIHFQTAFAVLMIPCYLYILYYGLSGHRVGTHTPSH